MIARLLRLPLSLTKPNIPDRGVAAIAQGRQKTVAVALRLIAARLIFQESTPGFRLDANCALAKAISIAASSRCKSGICRR